METILNDSTTWGAEATKIESNFSELYNNKVDKTSVVQTTGASLSDVMSQKAVTDEITKLAGDVSLLDAVQGAKIKDIENVLSTANLNQSTQLSMSGVSPLSLPKNAANGGMSVKLEGLTAENLVVNGDLRNGTDGWIHHLLFSTETIVDGNLRSTRNQQRPYFGRSITKIRLNDKIYYSLHIRGSKEGFADLEFGNTFALSEGGRISLSPITTTFNKKTNIHTVTSDLTAFFKIVAASATYNTSGDYLEIRGGSDGIKIINLTATFGAGNEPDLATCDAMFSDYFEGVKSFEPTGRVRGVGKNLFKMLTQTISTSGLTFEANKDRIKINGSVSSSTTFRVKISNRIEGSTAFNNTWQEERLQLIDGAPYRFSLKQISGSYSSSQNVTLRLATSTNNSVVYIGFPDGAFSNSDNQRACLYLVIYPNTTFTNYEFTVQIEKGTATTPYEPYRETSLYLTASELRSNGAVKDEIRKGANGYELVKRVGVGTSNGEIVTGGDFSDPTKWTVSGGMSIISNGTLKIIANAGVASSATQNKTITAGKIYRYTIDVLSITGVVYLYIGDTSAKTINTADSGKTISGFSLSSTGGSIIRLVKELGSNVSAEFDNISIVEYNTTEGVAIAGGQVVFGSNVHYTLATPVITPISYGGILNSAENGTVYHEPVVADAGVYSDKMEILLTDYPIATIEEIIKHENGVDTYLDVSTAVIAGDKLSFTHPSLQSGDLVLFTYAFDKESTNGNITATFYDSNVVKIDTVTGKAYKITDVVTNGILTRTLTEV